MNNVFLIEDHDEALEVWRKEKVKAFDLVHIDAHLDFGMHLAKPIQKIFNEARSLKELKRNLELSLSFLHYEDDFNKQTNIGNYIYPAMEEGIVKNFYWVIPGGLKEFKQSTKFIRNILKNLSRQNPQHTSHMLQNGVISINLFKRKFIICILERLPVLKQRVLLDIDTDFLVIDSLVNSNNTAKIGQREPWLMPKDLVKILKQKIKQPEIITIAYSVNGGYSPMIYRHLGDEIAYCFAPGEFKGHFQNKSQAAGYFSFFNSTGRKEYYQKAVKLNPVYRAADNNYGSLYLSLRKFKSAEKEFLKVQKADPKNPACLAGLGNIALERRDFKKAKRYFSSVLNSGNHGLFSKVREQSLSGLANAELSLKNFKRAKKLLFRYLAFEPLHPQGYYLLARIFEKEKDFIRAANFYKDALRLGFGGIEPLLQLLKISYHANGKDGTINFVARRYKEFKKGFLRVKRTALKKQKKMKNARKIEGKMRVIEKMLERRRFNARHSSFTQESGYGNQGN